MSPLSSVVRVDRCSQKRRDFHAAVLARAPQPFQVEQLRHIARAERIGRRAKHPLALLAELHRTEVGGHIAYADLLRERKLREKGKKVDEGVGNAAGFCACCLKAVQEHHVDFERAEAAIVHLKAKRRTRRIGSWSYR